MKAGPPLRRKNEPFHRRIEQTIQGGPRQTPLSAFGGTFRHQVHEGLGDRGRARLLFTKGLLHRGERAALAGGPRLCLHLVDPARRLEEDVLRRLCPSGVPA